MNLRALILPILLGVSSLASAATIDRINLATFGHYTQDYRPNGQFMLFSTADVYLLSDGSSWESGAGTASPAMVTFKSVTTSGSLITYTFNKPNSGLLYQQTDYDSGDHSAQGSFALPETLSIVAEAGSRTAVMKGYTEILSNDETWYGEPRFNYYSAPVGSKVYFEQTYTLSDDTFTVDLFSRSFRYNETGFIDFKKIAPVPEPSVIWLLLAGLPLALMGRRGGRSIGQ